MAGLATRGIFKNMNKQVRRNMLIGTALLMLAVTPASGADNSRGDGDDLYRANEFSLDAFGTASEGKYTIEHLSNRRIRNNTRLGVGAGITYFFTRYIGLGADAYSENKSGPFIDSTSGNLMVRVPLGQSGFAPYALGGGGYQFDPAKVGFIQAGAGMEYRFTPHFGAFVDARYVLPNRTKYYGVGRAGLRLAF